MKNFLATFVALSTFTAISGTANADNIERNILGTVKESSSGTGFTKVKEINGITYGLTRHKDGFGNFNKVTVDRWLASENKWAETPTTIFENDDVVQAGIAQGEDYTYNQFEALKWFSCAGTGKMSFYAKRINADAQGNKDYKNGKQLFGATVTSPSGDADSEHDAIRIGFPYGTASGDLGNMNVDGESYIISAGREDHTIRFIQLTDDCSDIVDADVPGAEPANTLQWYRDDGSAEPREAPSIFENNGYFYVMTSGATGWRPNQQKYAYSQEFLGDWSEMIPVGDRTAYHSQVFYVKGVNAENGSGQQAKIFSGTRNAAVWNGSDSRAVWTPLYFNTPESLGTNYYDYIDINNTTGNVIGGHFDHGTRLAIESAKFENHSDSLANIIDGDETTSWSKDNVDDARNIILYDLGSPQMVKAMKLKQYDNFNATKPGEVEQKVFKIRVEVGDGSNYTTVFEDIVPSISWLQSLDLDDTEGQFVKVTHIDTYNGGNNAVHKHFGFYETEFWGDDKNEQALINDDFSADVDGQLPLNWTVLNTNDNVSAEVIDDTVDGKVLVITDNSNNGGSYVKQAFTAQSGSELFFSTSAKFPVLGKGERIQLQQGDTKAIILENSAIAGGLAFINSGNEHIKVANITADIWLNIELKLSTDSDSYDIYLNGEMVWGGAVFKNSVSAIDKVVLASGWGSHTSVTYFDDVSLNGPIFSDSIDPVDPIDPIDPVDPVVTTLLSDDFENGFTGWIVEKDTWTIVNDGSDNVLTKAATSGTGFIHQGNNNWSDYTVSADVKRLGQSSAILGRYQANNKYYQFAIKSNGNYLLNVNNNGSWSKLAEESYSTNTSDYYHLSMTFLGNQITVSINGQQVEQITNNAISSGKVGFRSQNGASSFDNLEVVTEQ
jgi:hypothetical protein